MKATLVVLFALVGFSSAISLINLEFEFFNRFGNIKAKQECFGYDQATDQHKRVDAAITKCFQEFRAPELSNNMGTEAQATLFRRRRSYGPRYPASDVKNIADNIKIEVQYFRCVLREMGITDADNRLDLNSLVAQTESLAVRQALKDDLLHSVRECVKFAQCVPAGKDPYPLPNDVVVAQHYLFCENQVRSVACVNNDVSYIVDQIDFKGADGRLDFLETDADRAAAILFANAVVGPDDFGLYE